MPPARIPDEDVDISAAIQGGDILLHHPYDSFDMSVEDFIGDAADDPHTVAIKMTVYRIGDDTPFVRSLIRAAESGKQVACVIELQARFDEARNLVWARELEQAGAHVTYGVVGLKTHAKVALVVRKEGADLRCYAHIGTGNYHVSTARFYTDVGLLTCDSAITADVVKLFHYLTGHSDAPQFEKLLVAPGAMRQRFIDLVHREIAHHQARRPSLASSRNSISSKTWRCAARCRRRRRPGVPVDLIVRGLCCLAPGVPGLTDNVHVRSIIGRFLEHSRIFYFADGHADPRDGQFFIGSGDWMHRNLSRRVEVATPVEDRALCARLWEILDVSLLDNRQAWVMQRDGTYHQPQPTSGRRRARQHGLPRLVHRSRATPVGSGLTEHFFRLRAPVFLLCGLIQHKRSKLNRGAARVGRHNHSSRRRPASAGDEPPWRGAIREQALPAADHDRERPQVIAVDEIVCDECLRQLPASVHLNVGAWLLFERRDRRDHIADEQPGVVPADARERSRCDVLPRRVQDQRRGIVLGARPMCRKDVVRLSAEQQVERPAHRIGHHPFKAVIPVIDRPAAL